MPSRSVTFRLPVNIYQKLNTIRKQRGLQRMSPIFVDACREYADMHYVPEGIVTAEEAKRDILRIIQEDPEFRAELIGSLSGSPDMPPER